MKKNKNVRYNRAMTPEKFWTRIQKPVGCWLYDGAKESNGYGYLTNPFPDGPQFITAHKLAWILTNGPVPDGLLVLHKCDIRACCNPDHLFLGTDADNINDGIAKGRINRITRAKLTEDQVREIRRDFKAVSKRRTNARELAGRYNISVGVIHRIVTGDIWTHVR